MRLIIKVIFFVVAVTFAMQVIPAVVGQRPERSRPEQWTAGISAGNDCKGRTLSLVLPALSPFSAVSSAVAQQSAGLVVLLGFPVLVAGILKGRWFCFRLCPTGLIVDLAGRLRPDIKSKFAAFPQFGNIIALFAFGGAVLGYPLFIWLDPLCMFNGFFSVWHKPVTLVTMLPAGGLVLAIALTLWRPNAWCYRLCPLGALLEFLGKAWRRVHLSRTQETTLLAAGQKPAAGLGRRSFMTLLAGGTVGFFVRKITMGKHQPIRPPGAIDESQFAALCSRCGNCVRACPEKIILPDTGESGAAGFMTPVLKMDVSYCAEGCNECSRVCSTGAISRLSLTDKNDVAIGTAVVIKQSCLSWEGGCVCMVCDEYCPYHAIKKIKNLEVLCPEIDPEICRGCGSCQIVCPAEKKAIVVQGKPQRRLKHVELRKH